MSILDKNIINTTPPIEVVAQRMKLKALKQYQSLVDSYEMGLRDFWENPYYTPKELSNALGNDAAEIFVLHGTIKHTILQVNPEQELTSVDSFGSFTVNQDGTITIEEPSGSNDSGSNDSGSIEEPSGSNDSGSNDSGSIEEPSGSTSGSL